MEVHAVFHFWMCVCLFCRCVIRSWNAVGCERGAVCTIDSLCMICVCICFGLCDSTRGRLLSVRRETCNVCSVCVSSSSSYVRRVCMCDSQRLVENRHMSISVWCFAHCVDHGCPSLSPSIMVLSLSTLSYLVCVWLVLCCSLLEVDRTCTYVVTKGCAPLHFRSTLRVTEIVVPWEVDGVGMEPRT